MRALVTGPKRPASELEVGDTWLDEGRLHRWADDGVEEPRNRPRLRSLVVADATWTAEAATPGAGYRRVGAGAR